MAALAPTSRSPARPSRRTGARSFRGHLFVGDQLLSDSGMREHPLTPMSDADLVRVLQAQKAGARSGCCATTRCVPGAEATRARIQALRADGVALAVADAIDNDDLRVLAQACAELPLLTAGSGLALGLPGAVRGAGLAQLDQQAARLDRGRRRGGGAVGLVFSVATNAQVADVARRRAARADDRSACAGARRAGGGAGAATGRWVWVDAGPVLLAATAAPDALRAVQAGFAQRVPERWSSGRWPTIAAGLVHSGVRRIVVAGGETSGAVVQALGVRTLRIGPAICPGVPWTQAEGRDAQARAQVSTPRPATSACDCPRIEAS